MKVWYIAEKYECDSCCNDDRDGRLFADTEDGRLLLLGAVQSDLESRMRWQPAETEAAIDMGGDDQAGWEIVATWTASYPDANRSMRGRTFQRSETWLLRTREVLG